MNDKHISGSIVKIPGCLHSAAEALQKLPQREAYGRGTGPMYDPIVDENHFQCPSKDENTMETDGCLHKKTYFGCASDDDNYVETEACVN